MKRQNEKAINDGRYARRHGAPSFHFNFKQGLNNNNNNNNKSLYVLCAAWPQRLSAVSAATTSTTTTTMTAPANTKRKAIRKFSTNAWKSCSSPLGWWGRQGHRLVALLCLRGSFLFYSWSLTFSFALVCLWRVLPLLAVLLVAVGRCVEQRSFMASTKSLQMQWK